MRIEVLNLGKTPAREPRSLRSESDCGNITANWNIRYTEDDIGRDVIIFDILSCY